MRKLLFGVLLLAVACQPRHEAQEVARLGRLQRTADSLRLLAGWQQIQLNEYDSAQARTRRELKTFQTKHEAIRRTPAAAWPVDRVTGYLTDYKE